jgi:hypothetical protein
MTEKDGEIFQEGKKETKKTSILLGKKSRPEVSYKTYISQECRSLDEVNIILDKKRGKRTRKKQEERNGVKYNKNVRNKELKH